MKKQHSLLIFLLLFVSLFFAGKVQNVNAQTLSEAVLELYKNSNKEVSLGAMLISQRLYDDELLAGYIHKQRNDADPLWIKTIQNYALNHFSQRESSLMMRFISEFPVTKQELNLLTEFEANTFTTVQSKPLEYLIELASDRDLAIKNAAKEKLITIKGLADGWVANQLSNL